MFGAEYVCKLLNDHDGAIRKVRRLAELTRLDAPTADQIGEAIAGARSIMDLLTWAATARTRR